MVDRLDAEVTEQFFAHLEAFHVKAVNDAELERPAPKVEEHTAEVEALAAVVPSHPKAVAAHQAALETAEGALAEAEERLHELVGAAKADGPDARHLRDDWPTLTLAERRELLRQPDRGRRGPPRPASWGQGPGRRAHRDPLALSPRTRPRCVRPPAHDRSVGLRDDPGLRVEGAAAHEASFRSR